LWCRHGGSAVERAPPRQRAPAEGRSVRAGGRRSGCWRPCRRPGRFRGGGSGSWSCGGPSGSGDCSARPLEATATPTGCGASARICGQQMRCGPLAGRANPSAKPTALSEVVLIDTLGRFNPSRWARRGPGVTLPCGCGALLRVGSVATRGASATSMTIFGHNQRGIRAPPDAAGHSSRMLLVNVENHLRLSWL
jgi:hypothetical protein